MTVVLLTGSVTKIYPLQLSLPLEHSDLNRDSKAQVELRYITLERVQKTLSQLLPDLMKELGARLREHLAL